MESASNVSASSRFPIRIVHIITGLGTGGAEMSIFKLLSRIDRQHFDSVIIALQSGPLSERIRNLGIPVHEIGMRPNLAGPLKISNVIGLARKLKPDILHGWMPHGNLVAQCMAPFSAAGTPVIWSVRNSMASLSSENRATAALITMSALASWKPFCVLFNSQSGASQYRRWG